MRGRGTDTVQSKGGVRKLSMGSSFSGTHLAEEERRTKENWAARRRGYVHFGGAEKTGYKKRVGSNAHFEAKEKKIGDTFGEKIGPTWGWGGGLPKKEENGQKERRRFIWESRQERKSKFKPPRRS